jgi:hypothetical protein
MMSSVLILALSAGLLALPVGLVMKKYRRHLQKLVMVCSVLFAGLLVTDSLIYWGFRSVENEGGLVLDCHPFIDMVLFTLNRQAPCMFFVVIGTLMFMGNMEKKVPLLISLAVAGASICGFLLLAHYVCSDCAGEGLRAAAWWL